MENIRNFIEENFKKQFSYTNKYIFSSGGRFEILGNHTDHNHGKCLAATCNLCITAAVSPRKDNLVHFISNGYTPVNISLDDLNHIPGDTSSGEMIKGIAKYFKDNGYKVGGFDAFTYSTIFPGAGVSSSAAFELLVAQIFNELFNEKNVPTLLMCKAGQYSENNYYEKKSGLLDQIGVGYGNIVSIDFEDIKNPKILEIEFPFKDLHFVLVNSGGSHAGLNDLYSAIPQDMYNAAKKAGKVFLRETTQKEVESAGNLTDMELSRAKHYFGENQRVEEGISALKNHDRAGFLSAINGSRISSTMLLKNMMVEGKYKGSPLEACERAMKIMDGKGACKINGGGFAGSIVCVVPNDCLKTFIEEMKKYYGDNSVCEVFVRPVGPIKEN